MNLCTIVPINQKEWMNNRPYTMLLAHLAKENRSYSRWASYLNSYKIMDNSVIELGEAFTLNDLLKQASLCQVQEIILPDVFRNSKATIKLAQDCYSKICDSPYRNKFKLMAVCHGNSREEVRETFKELDKMKFIDVIGMPKVIGSWGNRNDYKDLYLNSKKEIHYLGCWYSFKEIIEMDDILRKRIRSFDTCLPSLLAIQSKNWNEERDLSYTIDLVNDNVPKKKYDKIMDDLKFNINLE